MIRFIFFCMAIIAILFAAMPIFYGVANQHQKLAQTSTIEKESNELTFDEIFALASGQSITNPSTLNSIESAAGEAVVLDKFSDGFSDGFSGQEDSALANSNDETPTLEKETSF